MIKLGFWQLDRSNFKAHRQNIINQRSSQAIKPLPSQLMNPDEQVFARVIVEGEYQSEQSFLVDNAVENFVAGLLAITPFKVKDSDMLILVNRGWLPWGKDRSAIPKLYTPKGHVELTGQLIPSASDNYYLSDPANSTEPNSLWSQLDLARFVESSKMPVQPLILLLDEDELGSYKHIRYKHNNAWINRHKAYAVQWFSLALTLLIIYSVLAYKNWIKKDLK